MALVGAAFPGTLTFPTAACAARGSLGGRRRDRKSQEGGGLPVQVRSSRAVTSGWAQEGCGLPPTREPCVGDMLGGNTSGSSCLSVLFCRLPFSPGEGIIPKLQFAEPHFLTSRSGWELNSDIMARRAEPGAPRSGRVHGHGAGHGAPFARGWRLGRARYLLPLPGVRGLSASASSSHHVWLPRRLARPPGGTESEPMQ